MDLWTKQYNELPMEARVIAGKVMSAMRINQLNIEKDRLKRRYRQSMAEINLHIKSLKEWIQREEAPRRVGLPEECKPGPALHCSEAFDAVSEDVRVVAEKEEGEIE